MENDQLLVNQFIKNHPLRATEMIEKFAVGDIAKLLENVSADLAGTVLQSMTPYNAARVLEVIREGLILELLMHLSSHHTEAILRQMNSKLRERILLQLPENLGKSLKIALSFQESQVGAHTETEVLTLLQQWTAEKALNEIRRGAEHTRPVIFVLDDDNKLTGYVAVNRLVTSDSSTIVEKIMETVEQPITAQMMVRDAIDHWDNRFVELPVVRGDGMFIGVVNRVTLQQTERPADSRGKLEIKTGNALGDLYLIGLTSLLGNTDQNIKH